MNPANFETFRQCFDEECAQILLRKGNDYASGGDRFANFKRIADRLGVSPVKVWAVYFMKHVDAILQFVKAERVESEPIRGRFADARNYLDLGIGLIQEMIIEEEQKRPG